MQNRRVVILGVTGSLGSYLVNSFKDKFEILAPRPRHKRQLDASHGISWLSECFDTSRPKLIARLIREARADVIINCVAVTPASITAKNRRACIEVNGLLPHYLADAASETNSYLVHFSTDAVFSGNRGSYSEADDPDPRDLYGWSKLLGEVEAPNCLTIRTSFFGQFRTGRGLFNWLLSQQESRVAGYVNYIFSGLPVETVACAVRELIESECRPSGIIHVGGQAVSKYCLIAQIIDRMQLTLELSEELLPIPVDRSLDSSKFWALMGSHEPTLEESMDLLVSQHSLNYCRPKPDSWHSAVSSSTHFKR